LEFWSAPRGLTERSQRGFVSVVGQEVIIVADRETEKHADHSTTPDDGSELRKTVVSALIQAAAREVMDHFLRMLGRGGPF